MTAKECWGEIKKCSNKRERGPDRRRIADEEAIDIIQKHIDRAVSEATKVDTHNLKTWPDAFERIWSGKKRHEYRKDDRGFAIGNELVLQEFDPNTETYSGRTMRVRIVDIDHGPDWGVPKNWCVMTISDPYDKRKPFA